MKVLQIARYGSVKGGAETYVRALCDGLRARGHDVRLAYALDPDPSRPEVRDGYEVPELARQGPGGKDHRASRLAQVIRAFDPDVIHCHVADPPWAASLCNALAPTILAAHDHRLDSPAGTKYWAGWDRECTIRPGVWCLAYNVAARCGSLRANATLRPYRAWKQARNGATLLGFRVHAFSEYMRTQLVRARVDPRRVAVIPYPAPRPPAPVAPSIAPDPRPVVLASGRLNREKGFHLLIDALANLPVRCHVVIAGDGHARGWLERRARTATGGHAITFAGWLSPGELAGWHERAAVVAVPSAWPEPFGIVGLEAMAAGRAVVAFDVGGIREWLADGECGVLVPPGDTAAFGSALRMVLEDEGTRRRMGEAGRARAVRDFSLEGHLDRLLPLYEEVSASR